MSTPLLMLGPGGDFTTRVAVKGTRLKIHARHAAATPAAGASDSREHQHRDPAAADRRKRAARTQPRPTVAAVRGGSGVVRAGDSFSLTAPLHAAAAWLDAQDLARADFVDQLAGLQRLSETLTPADSIGESARPESFDTDSASGPPAAQGPTATRLPAFVLALRRAKARLRQAAPVIASAPGPCSSRDAVAVQPISLPANAAATPPPPTPPAPPTPRVTATATASPHGRHPGLRPAAGCFADN